MTNTNRSKAVHETVQKARAGKDSFISLSTGVILKPIRVPNMLFPEIMSRFERPKAPRVFIADLGREEENAADPDYISKLSTWQSEFTKAIVDAMIILGTEIEFIPEEIEKQDSEKWLRKLSALRINPKGEEERYLLWIKMIAAPTDTDIQLIMEKVGQLSGVSEADVSDAVEQFRNSA